MAGESQAIEISEHLKASLDRMENNSVQWAERVWAKHLAALQQKVPWPKSFWSWIVFVARILASPRTLLVFLLVLLIVIVTAICTLVRAAAWWWEKLKKEPVGAVAILLTVAGLGAAIVAGVLRFASRQTVVLIAPFELTATPPKALPITGKTAADLLKDEVFEIKEAAQEEVSGTEESYARAGKGEARTGPEDPAPARLVTLGEGTEISGVAIEVEGISLEKIVAQYRSIRSHERRIEGDVIFTGQAESTEPGLDLVSAKGNSACRVMLQARVTGTGSWSTTEHQCDGTELKAAAHELAEKILMDLYPDTLALYLQHEGRMDQALEVLRKLVEGSPQDSESRLELGEALDRNKDYDRAIEEYTQVLALDPEQPALVHDKLGYALYKLGKIEDAAREYRSAIRANGNYIQAHIDLGYLLRYQGDPDGAEAEFRRAQSADRESAKAHEGYGNLLDDEWKLEDAIREFRSAVRLMPGQPAYHTDLASELDKKGKFDASIAEYREVVRQKPNDAWSHLRLSWVLIENGQIEEGILEIRKALELKEKFPEAHAYLAVASEAQGDREGAIQEYEEALKLQSEVSGPAENTLTWAGCNLGLAYRTGGDYQKFQETIEKYIQSQNGQDSGDAARCYADALRNERDFGNSIFWYDDALRKGEYRDPYAYLGLGYAYDDMREEIAAYNAFDHSRTLREDADVHLGLGSVYENAGLRPDAIREYRQALKARPDSGDAWRSLANALETEGELDEARSARANAEYQYQIAVHRRPGDPSAHNDHGNVLEELGQYEEAVGEHQEALRLWPSYYLFLNDLGSTLDAWVDQVGSATRHQDQAIAQYRLATERKQNFTVSHNNLGLALDEQGHHWEAIAEYQTVLAHTPNDLWGHTDMGLTYDDLGKFPEAIAEHRAAIEISSWFVHYVGEAFGFPEGHSNLCRALNHNGDYEEAIAECRKALDLFPRNYEGHLNLADALSNKAEHCRYCWKSQVRREAKREYATAADESELALRLRPNAPGFYLSGRAYEGFGNFDKAIEKYQTALDWDFIYPRAHYHLGLALRKMRNFAEADEQLSTAHQQDPLLVPPAP